MQLTDILSHARDSNKNILIIGSPRSGTHALGSLVSQLDTRFINHGELFLSKRDHTEKLDDLIKICSHDTPSVSHVVQLLAKVFLSPYVDTLKDHVIVVNLKRNNKIKQFASWMYFNKFGSYTNTAHNHKVQDTSAIPGSITATSEDVDRFMVEQLTDDFFLADYILYYENLDLKQSQYQQNQYSFPIETIFSNLEYVNERLRGWKYPSERYDK